MILQKNILGILMNYIKKSILRYFMIHYYNHIFLCLSNETWSPTHFFKGEQKYDTLWWDKTYEINQPRSFHEMSWFSYIKFVGRRAVSVFDFWENLSTSSRWMISMISIYYVEDSPPIFPTSERMKFYFDKFVGSWHMSYARKNMCKHGRMVYE